MLLNWTNWLMYVQATPTRYMHNYNLLYVIGLLEGNATIIGIA